MKLRMDGAPGSHWGSCFPGLKIETWGTQPPAVGRRSLSLARVFVLSQVSIESWGTLLEFSA